MELIIYIFLLIGVIVGYRQGALKQIANFLGIALGLVIAAVAYHQFGDFLADKTGAAVGIGRILAFVVIVVFVPLILGWVASLLAEILKKLKLNFFNRLIGAAVGFVSYALILSVAFNILDFIASNGGCRPQKLEERPELYYSVKHLTQVAIPDILIVTDKTEEENGAEPKHGIQPVIDEASEKLNPLKKVNE
ncbi:MAG: CvpA family protein [Prevotellaceae bacterium]|nr:CvpA family protein [Prevotellaceae bacterium]